MSAKTSIEWTDRTWNPVRGCTVVSVGCKNCYAMKVAARFNEPGMAYEGLALRSPARWTGAVRLIGKDLDAPLRWRKPQKVFVNSMSDLFHEGLSTSQLEEVFAVMAYAPQHTFQVLTKRPQRMLEFIQGLDRLNQELEGGDGAARWLLKAYDRSPRRRARGHLEYPCWPLPNVWLGVSVEDQESADERIPILRETPAAVRFLSVEPLLGPVDLSRWLYPHAGPHHAEPGDGLCAQCCLNGFQWAIVGGESGPGARPLYVPWVRRIRRQCHGAGVAFFFKQAGAYVTDRNDAGFDAMSETWADGPDAGRPTRPGAWPEPVDVEDDEIQDHQGATVRVRLGDRKGGDPSEWPEDLRVREFPEVPRA